MTIPSHTVFRDPVLDDKFRQDGYVVTPLLESDEVRQLLAIDEAFPPDTGSDFYTSVYHSDREQRSRVRHATESILMPRVLSLLVGYRTANSAFVNKRAATTRGTVPMHQDYTFVDQSKFTSVHAWIPLVDVDEENACLCVYPGTHSLVNHICAMPSSTITCHPSPYDRVRSLVEKNCGVRVPMSAGSALFFNERLLHSSGENKTSSRRVVVGAVCIPEGEPTRVYCLSPDQPGMLDVVTVDDFADLHLITGKPVPYPYPEGMSHVDTVEYHPESLEPAQILPLYRPQPPATVVGDRGRADMDYPAPPVVTRATKPNKSRLVSVLRRAKRALFSDARP